MPITTAQLVDQALDALKPKDGFHAPSREQVREADARANVAIAAALTRIAGALEEIAFNRDSDTTVQPTIHHSV
ncbi:hypothetical protein [Streptomyces sp. AHA2]|uniref:hypothetical protein n=1 Tax=Streptomyces sp. AHA2 TaxID=3064526 RepID=UPI002FE35308